MSSDSGLWYYSVTGQQQGPVTGAQIIELIRTGKIDRTAYVYDAAGGSGSWVPVSNVAVFSQVLSPVAPPQPPSGSAIHKADEIDYELHGDDMQFVEITLDPREACIAEAGSFMFMEPGIEMETIFGD